MFAIMGCSLPCAKLRLQLSYYIVLAHGWNHAHVLHLDGALSLAALRRFQDF
jgi:hypothetical protein